MRILIAFLLVALATACSHPLEIVGEGDILSASGERDCLLEDYQAAADNCTKNFVKTSYQETYYAQPRTGWKFDRWENYCKNQSEASCSFDMPESAVQQAIGRSVPALRAIFAQEEVPNRTCNGGVCIIYVLPGIEIEADAEDTETLANGGFKVVGDVQIYTPEGGVVLAEADLVIEPGVAMIGTSLAPDYAIGDLAGSPSASLPRRVSVETMLGADVNLEVPLYAAVHYVVFTLDGLVNTDIDFDIVIGNLQFPVPDGVDSWRMILDPVDPFLYVGVDQSLLIPSIGFAGLGPDVTDIGYGYGLSLGGRIPFEPSVPPAIQEVLPEVRGDSIYYGSLDLTQWLAFLEARLEGIIITDEDPDENGAYIFGSSEAQARDRIRATTGTFTPNFSIPLVLGWEFDPSFGDQEPLPFTLITSKTGMGTASERSEAWFSFDLTTLTSVEEAANGWLQMPGERAASVFYFGPEGEGNFFRAATETVVEIDAARMAAVHGVAASELLVQQSVFEINANELSFTSESLIESFHPDVSYIGSRYSRLVIPLTSESQFDLLIETSSEIGGVSLRNYGQQLTEESFRHWGEYVTPNYGYRLEGFFSDEGAWLEGSADARLPYRYAEVDLIADIAGQIAAMEEVERLAEADYEVNLAQLRDYQEALERESDALDDKKDALRSAENWLDDKRDELSDARNRNCGSCKPWELICVAKLTACLAWREATIPFLEGVVSTAQGSVNFAQGGVNLVQRSYDEAALLVEGAQRAINLALASRSEARIALTVLRVQRGLLPLEDGVIDARVVLRLTRGGLTGTVSGTFQGVPFSDGMVVNDAAGSRACLIVPQTGEELCTAL